MESPTSELLIYQNPNGTIKIDVRLEEETVWLTQAQMATLFGKGRTTITEHILNVFEEGELDETMVCRNFRHTTPHGAIEGKTQEREVKYYNLDVIISVGYRVKSPQGTQFRIWATQRLKEYIIKGFALNDDRFKSGNSMNYFNELQERIREPIKASIMTTARQILILLSIAIFGLVACQQKHAIQIRGDFKRYYDEFKVHGSFALYDPQEDKYIFYNQAQFTQTVIPASTFKICNSLIGLETGVIRDEHFVIPWDSIPRYYSNWNRDHDLKSAFQNSTVWYYQELARRVGGDQLKYWMDKADYGNADTTGGIDKFWLTGGLRISPKQQIDFLKRLHDNELPFSQRTIDIVKDIMIMKDTLDYVVRAKTGLGIIDNNNTGWYVGYLETKGNVYYFSNCIQSTDQHTTEFVLSRKEIVYRILDELQLAKK